MSDGQLVIDTLIDTDGVEKGLIRLNSLVKTGMKAAVTAIAGVGTALAGAAGYAIKVGSDFEAGMSEVSAISGATGVELDTLTAKAKEMGADTKFSATESAEAFKYMAMAGWNSGQMCDGIAGIMDLAAASGENLASTSDIVTDALTAFGLKASDSSHFADVLAKASSSANTNVSLMGETFKYVAPIAGALGYNVEDMSVAIGLMANSGIKGSEAGTALRSVLSRMAKPTDETKQAMTALGLSLTNADGSMKSFGDVMVDMRKGFSGLTQEQKASYSAMLGGQEAMSGLLAIANASETDFDNLTQAIANCDGAAHNTATTMTDNLRGAIDNLQGAVETLGIEVYEGLQVPLKNLAKQGATYVDELTTAFETSGLDGLVGAIGSVFSEVAIQAAQAAPGMITAATEMIKSFNKGLSDNAGDIVQAGIDIAKALIAGIGDIAGSLGSLAIEASKALVDNLFSSSVSKKFTDFTNVAKKSFESMKDSLTKIIGKMVTVLGNLTGALSSIGKTVLPALTQAVKFCADNFNVLLPLVLATLAAFKGYAIVTGIKAAIDGLTVGIEGATTAQKLWNLAMSANTIGLVVAGVAGLTTAIAAYALTEDQSIASSSDFSKVTQELIDKHNNLCKASQDLTAEINNNRQAREDNKSSIENDAGAAGILSDKLFDLADKENKSAAEKQLMAEMVDKLNELMPDLKLNIDKETGALSKNKDEINNCIEARKKQLMLKAAEDDLTNIAKEQYEAQKRLSEAESDRASVTDGLARAQEELTQAQQNHNDAITSFNGNTKETGDRLKEAKENVKQYQKAIEESDAEIQVQADNVQNASKEFDTCSSYISDTSAEIENLKNQSMNFGDVSTNVSSSLGKTWNDIVSAFNNGTDLAGNALDTSEYDMSHWSDIMQELSAKGVDEGILAHLQEMGEDAPPYLYALTNLTDEQISEMNNSWETKFNPESAETAMSDTVAGINDSLTTLVDGFVNAENGSKESLERQVQNAYDIYQQMKRAFADGEPGVTAQMVENAGKMVNASVQELNKVEPQSELVMKTAGQMAADAIGSKAGDVADASGTVGNAAINALRSIFGSARQAGEQTTDEYASGAESEAGTAQSATQEVSNQANSGLTSADTSGSGTNFIRGFINGIKEKASDGSLWQTVINIGSTAVSWLNHSIDAHSPARKTKKSGKYFSQGFAIGIEDNVDCVNDAVSNVADQALSGLDDFNFDSTIDTSSLTLQMEQAVADVTAHLGANVATNVSCMVTNTEDKQSKNNAQQPIVIEVPLTINGREFAKATTPYISEQLTDDIRGRK